MTLERRIQQAAQLGLSWDPVNGGRKSLVCFKDHVVADLGPDLSGERFQRISHEMLTGDYYPHDAVRFFGDFRSEGRQLQVGDRVLQFAPLFPFTDLIGFWSSVEIFVANRAPDSCRIGYVTTTGHHGKGKWSACLRRTGGKLTLTIDGTAMPQSLLFWLGVPVARYLQKRAWRRAIEHHSA